VTTSARNESLSRERRLASFLGWFSLGLGAPQIAAPSLVNRLIGVRDDAESRFWQRVVGVREIAAWAGILRSPRPAGWLWARVAGDVKDIGLLSAAFRKKKERPGRLAAATASVAGVTALDLYTAIQMTRKTDSGEREHAIEARAAITVRKPLAEVFGVWEKVQNLPLFMEHVEEVRITGDRRSHWTVNGPAGRTMQWDIELVDVTPNEMLEWRSLEGSYVKHSGTVRFMPAPGLRGTEVHLAIRYDAPGGKLAEAVVQLLGEDPIQQVKDDLRRFKQLLETGQIVRSESTPEGTGARGFIRQRPAQPLEQAEAVAPGRRTS
jgi:uncharacterized membrane protein